MDTSTLRWILIVIGVIVLVSIRLFFNPEKKRKPKASRPRSREVYVLAQGYNRVNVS